MKGLVLAGGTGSRLRPITHTGPKQLVPVANKPVIQYGIEDLREAGITEIGIVLGDKGREEIQSFLGDGSEFGVNITYIIQGEPLGLAHAAACARDFVGDDDFVMYLGDNIFKRGLTEMVERYETGEYAASIALQHVDTPRQFGIADVDDGGTVTELIEKPDEPPTDLALVGVYLFSPAIFDAIDKLEPSWRGELEITDAIQSLIEDGHAVDSHVVDGWWKDTGKPEDIVGANRLVLEDIEPTNDGDIHPDADLTGRVDIGTGTTIEAGAVIRGPVRLGENVTIGTDTYVGPYTAIGDNSTVAGPHIENSVVVGESDLTAGTRLVDCLLGRGASITSADGLLPEGNRLVVGENSNLQL